MGLLDKTGGKYAGAVDRAQEVAKDAAKKALDGDDTPGDRQA